MREIKFRGKMYSGEWINGSLIDWGNGVKLIMPISEMASSLDIGSYVLCKSKSVVEETVGQYTGLKDKNGVEIYEGDIIRTKKYGKQVGKSNVNDYDIFKVVYSPCAFRLVRENPDRCFNLVDDRISNIEVIGNIYDNPELLKGDKE